MEIVKNFIIRYYKTALTLLIGLFILYWVIVILTPNSTMSKVDKDKLDSLTNVVNQINKEQEVLENEIKVLTKEVDKIDDNISTIKTNKTKTGKKYHEEISRVDKYTESELDRFFSNRYK
jgi:septal ring factor EnvC (AmiA/AmiB activator)